MLIAGEASGDMLAAELVQALRLELLDAEAIPTTDFQPLHASLEPRFFGAGGPRLAAAGMDLAFDMTAHSVIGLSGVLKNYFNFRRLFVRLYNLALDRQPDAIICVDFSGFNSRFAHGIRQYVRGRSGWFHDWRPKVVQYVSPQVWASRPGRVYRMAQDYDLLLSILPFEKPWYARRVPQLRVEFVGHPIVDRHANARRGMPNAQCLPGPSPVVQRSSSPMVLLLPGSRPEELSRHLPVMIQALAIMRAQIHHLRARLVLPTPTLVGQAKALGLPANLEVQSGGLAESLAEADVSLASTGTVTLECAYFGVPTVALYKASWTNYHIAKRIVKVRYLAMPNLLAEEQVFPEFIQQAATPQNIAGAALEFLADEGRRNRIKSKLAQVIGSLGGPGASRRAARAIVHLLVGHSLSHPMGEGQGEGAQPAAAPAMAHGP